jgi:hypothetical protein
MKVFGHDDKGYFTKEIIAQRNPRVSGEFLVPANSVMEPPPAIDDEHEAKWNGTAWEVVDGREFKKAQEQLLELKNEHGTKLYEDFRGKARKRKPQDIVDNDRANAAKRIEVNRFGHIEDVAWMVDRHRDEIDLGMNTTLTDLEYQELLQYRQAWREVKNTMNDPLNPDLPQVPAFAKTRTEEIKATAEE